MEMGKVVCSELEEGNLDFTGLLLAVVIALTLLIICKPPPRRRVFAVHQIA